MKKCRLCEHDKLSDYYKLDDKGRMLYRCVKCGFIQMLVPPVDELDSVASEESIFQDIERDTSPEDMVINEKIGISGPMSRMTHILQQDSFSLKEEFPELDLHLLEISKERMKAGIKSFKPNLSDFTFYHCLLDDDFANNHFEKFDITFSFHVLEHVYNIKGFIKNMFDITRKGGLMILELPNEDDDLSLLSDNYRKIIHFPAHVSHFTKDMLSKLVEESGIEDRVEVSFIPTQRYGFFNYIDWVRHNKKDKILSDDYVPRENPTWIEKKWLQTKEDNFTTDSITMILKKSW